MWGWLGAVALSLGVVACGSSSTTKASPRVVESDPEARARAAERALQSRDSMILAHAPPGTFGPHLAIDGGRRLAVWAIEGGARTGWYSLSIPTDRAPGAAARIADVTPGLNLVRLRPDGTVGFVALSSRRTGEHEVIEALQLGADGSRRGGPRVVAETPSEVVWLEAVPTSRGALVVWAEKNGEQADVYAVPLGLLGNEANPRRIVRGALAWQVARFGTAAALATVEASGKDRNVVVRFIGDDGASAAPDVKIAEGVRADLDLDLVVARGRTVVGFSEIVGGERRLMLASLDESGALERPRAPATPPRGGQRLFGLLGEPSAAEVFAIWEEERSRPSEGRRLELAVVDAAGRLPEGPSVSLFTTQGDPLLPVFEPSPEGLLAAAEVRLCEGGSRACADVAPEPVALALDKRLVAQAILPLRMPALENAVPDLVWDLECESKDCWALLARAEDPAPVFLQRIGPAARKSASLASLGSVLVRPALPRVRADQPVLEVPDLVDIDVWTPTGGAPTLTWLSYFDPSTPYVRPTTLAPDGKKEPVRAILRSEALPVPGGPEMGSSAFEALRKANEREGTISWRAHSLGGLSIAEGVGGERLLAWSALDVGKPQVFVTLLDAAGKKAKQRMLTTGADDVSDVAVVRIEAGWLVAWVETRGERTEVLAARLDDRLATVGTVQSITSDAVAPTGVRLLARGDRVLAAWSDARGAARPGYGDVYVSSFSAKDGSILGAPQKLAATELHSYGLSLTARGEGAALGWIEGEPDVEGSTASALLLVDLDAVGRAAASPTRATVPGRPTSIAMSCEKGCRVAVTVDTGKRAELWGFTFEGGVASQPSLLSVLSAPRAEAVTPEFVGDALFYVDAFDGERRVVRRLDAVWR